MLYNYKKTILKLRNKSIKKKKNEKKVTQTITYNLILYIS